MLFPDAALTAALQAASVPSDVLRTFTEFRIHTWIGAVARKNTPIVKSKKLAFVSENDGEILQLTEEESLFKNANGTDYDQLGDYDPNDQRAAIGYDPGLEEHVISSDPVVTILLAVESYTDTGVVFKRGYGVVPRSYDGRYAYVGKLYGPSGVLTGNLVHISRKVLYGAKVPVYGYSSYGSGTSYEFRNPNAFSFYYEKYSPSNPFYERSVFESMYGKVLSDNVEPYTDVWFDGGNTPFYIIQYSESNPESQWVRHVSEVDGSQADFPISGYELTPGGVIVLDQLSLNMAKVL